MIIGNNFAVNDGDLIAISFKALSDSVDVVPGQDKGLLTGIGIFALRAVVIFRAVYAEGHTLRIWIHQLAHDVVKPAVIVAGKFDDITLFHMGAG
jgi:hypothetical protein